MFFFFSQRLLNPDNGVVNRRWAVDQSNTEALHSRICLNEPHGSQLIAMFVNEASRSPQISDQKYEEITLLMHLKVLLVHSHIRSFLLSDRQQCKIRTNSNIIFILQIYRAKASQIHRPVQLKYNHFSFFLLLRYTGPLTENSGLPRIIYILSFHYNNAYGSLFIQTLEMTAYTLSTFSDPGRVVFANQFASSGVQSNSANQREARPFDFQMLDCDSFNLL